MDGLSFDELRARHSRLARWHKLFAESGHYDACEAIFLTGCRVFEELRANG